MGVIGEHCVVETRAVDNHPICITGGVEILKAARAASSERITGGIRHVAIAKDGPARWQSAFGRRLEVLEVNRRREQDIVIVWDGKAELIGLSENGRAVIVEDNP